MNEMRAKGYHEIGLPLNNKYKIYRMHVQDQNKNKNKNIC